MSQLRIYKPHQVYIGRSSINSSETHFYQDSKNARIVFAIVAFKSLGNNFHNNV